MENPSLEIQYRVALSVMNALVGIRFAALQKVLSTTGDGLGQVEQHTRQFESACEVRDGLGTLDLGGLQALIDEYGPLVRQVAGAAADADDGGTS